MDVLIAFNKIVERMPKNILTKNYVNLKYLTGCQKLFDETEIKEKIQYNKKCYELVKQNMFKM